MNASPAMGRDARWLRLAVTGILLLAAAACWLAFGFCLYGSLRDPQVGSPWGWNGLLALAAIGWLAALTTCMLIYGIARLQRGSAAWERRRMWSVRALRVTTLLFIALALWDEVSRR